MKTLSRLIAAVALAIILIALVIGFIESTWAASFRDENYNVYMARAYLCAAVAAAALAGLIALFWNYLFRMGQYLRKRARPSQPSS
jgi:hypothetical protein